MDMELSKSNQKGFVLILFLTILPLIVLALSGLAVTLLYVEAKAESRHLCRQALFQTQKQVGQNLTLLMQLNTTAKSLRVQLRIQQVALAAAGGPETPMGAAIAARILQIEEQKLILGQQQKALILESELEMRTGSLRSELQVRSSLHQKQMRFAHLIQLSPDQVSSSLPHLAVRPDDPSDTAPVYELETPFTEKQSLQTFWKIRYSWNEKLWINRNLHWRQISVDDSCRASLEAKNKQFRPVLNEAKF